MLVMAGCSDSYLEPDPMSFYEPTATYTNEAGLQSAMAMCDRHLLTILIDGNWNHVSLSSNYMMSDIGLYAKTDMGDGFQDNFAEKLTPTTGLGPSPWTSWSPNRLRCICQGWRCKHPASWSKLSLHLRQPQLSTHHPRWHGILRRTIRDQPR